MHILNVSESVLKIKVALTSLSTLSNVLESSQNRRYKRRQHIST